MIESKEGYKNSEIGVIPEEWEVVKLQEYIKLTSGKFNPKKNLQDEKNDNFKYPVYGANGVTGFFTSYLVSNPTIIIGRVGEYCGSVHLEKSSIWITDNAIYTKDINSKFNIDFLYKTFDFIGLKKLAEKTGQPKITQEPIYNLKVSLPPLKEQKKIADILSSVDEKIDIVSNQIEKAERLKKGLLQKLLSEGIGHNRFKNSELGKIPESWEVVKLGDISKITMGQSPKSNTYNSNNIGMPLIQGNADCKNRKTIPRIYTTEVTKKCFVGDIIMTVRAPVGAVSKSLHNACLGRGVCSIKSKEDNKYIYHYLVDFEDKWDKLSQGSTFTAVSGNDIKNLKIPLPPLQEQKEIADILSTADEKIEILRTKKQKYEIVKKGLLQKLLSGEIRTL